MKKFLDVMTSDETYSDNQKFLSIGDINAMKQKIKVDFTANNSIGILLGFGKTLL